MRIVWALVVLCLTGCAGSFSRMDSNERALVLDKLCFSEASSSLWISGMVAPYHDEQGTAAWARENIKDDSLEKELRLIKRRYAGDLQQPAEYAATSLAECYQLNGREVSSRAFKVSMTCMSAAGISQQAYALRMIQKESQEQVLDSYLRLNPEGQGMIREAVGNAFSANSIVALRDLVERQFFECRHAYGLYE